MGTRRAIGRLGLVLLWAAAIVPMAAAQTTAGRWAGHGNAQHTGHSAAKAAATQAKHGNAQRAAPVPASHDRQPTDHRDHSCCPEHGCCAAAAAAATTPRAPETQESTAVAADPTPAPTYVYIRPPFLLPLWIGPPAAPPIDR